MDEQSRYIHQLEEKVESMNKKFQEIAAAPRTVTTTTNNNTQHNTSITQNNNVLNLGDNELIRSRLARLKPEDVADGQISLAKFVVDNLLTADDGTPLYKCTDSARQNFSYLNEHGWRDKDVKCTKLTQSLVRNDINKVAWQTGEKLWKSEDSVDEARKSFFEEKVMDAAQLGLDNSEFSSTVSKLTV